MRMNSNQYAPLMQFLDKCDGNSGASAVKAGVYVPARPVGQTIHSETHPLMAVEFPAEGGGIVHLFDRNAPGIKIHFTGEGGAAEKIVIANAGVSGETAYKPLPKIIEKFAAVVRAKPDTEIPGVVISAFAGALGIRNVNVHDSRSGHSTIQWDGAKKGIAAIQEVLREEAGHYFPTPAYILAAKAAHTVKPGMKT